MINEKHINNSLDKIRSLFNKASERIEALKQGEKIPATKLAEDIAKEIGMTGAQIYPVLIFLIKDYPGMQIKKGASGGISRLPIIEETAKDLAPTLVADEIKKEDNNEE
jgi:hypothetical protein